MGMSAFGVEDDRISKAAGGGLKRVGTKIAESTSPGNVALGAGGVILAGAAGVPIYRRRQRREAAGGQVSKIGFRTSGVTRSAKKMLKAKARAADEEAQLVARVNAMPSMQRRAAQSRAMASPSAQKYRDEQDALWNQAGR